MTNNERDTLLINLATSVNNIQNTLNDFRKENQEEHKRIENSLRAEINAVDKKLDKTAKRLDTKIDKTAEELRAEMKQQGDELRAEMKESEIRIKAELRAEIKKSAENTTKELKDFIAFDDTGITEMFRDVWAREVKRDERLDKHDLEIAEIKTKLA